MSEAKQSIVKLIKDKMNCKSFRWSQSVGLDVQGTTLVITLASNKAGKNMQHLSACFEGWATILKTYVIDSMPDKYNQVELRCSDLVLPIEPSTANGHLMRFLYRVLRFSEQYDWFTMDDELADVINSFKPYLQKRLVNNYPNPFDSKAPAKIKESTIEFLLSKKPTDGTDKTLYTYFNKIGIPNDGLTIDHQLPVGLFIGTKGSDTRFFPGGKAAIDLWGLTQTKPNDFYIFELKYSKETSKNKKVGIISETFFYANYMVDLLDKNGAFTINEDAEQKLRNYSTIVEFKHKELNKIHAVMLVNKGQIYPAITPELLAVLNQGNQKAIEYSLAEYEFDEEKRIITYIGPK